MARKKAARTRDGAGAGEDRSAVLTEERSDEPASTVATETDDAVSLDDGSRDADEHEVADRDDTATDTAVVADADDGDDAVDRDDTVDTVAGTDAVADTDADTDTDTDDATVAHGGTEVDTDDRDVDDHESGDDTDDELDDDFDDEDDDARPGVSRPAFFVTLGVAAVAVLGVLFLLGAFVWPAFLGPGSPVDTANRSVSALGAKDSAQLGEISCVRLDGKPSAAFPPELLALIGSAAPAGPPTQTLDTEARAPVDLTLTQGGQSQALPADLLFAVNGGDWCLNGISPRQ